MIKKLVMSFVLVTLGLSQTQAIPKTWGDTFFGSNTRKAATLSAGLLAAGATATAVNYFKQEENPRSLIEAGKLVFTGPWNWATKETTNKVVAGLGALLVCYGLYKYFQTPEEPTLITGRTEDGMKKAPVAIAGDKNIGKPDTLNDEAIAMALQAEEYAAVKNVVPAGKVNMPFKGGGRLRR